MDTNALPLNPGEQMQDDETLYLAQECFDNGMVYSSYDHLQDSLAPVPQITLEYTRSDPSSYQNGIQLMRADESNPLLLNTTGSWNGSYLDVYGGNIPQQFIEHGFSDEQAVSDTNKSSFFAQALDLDPWNPSEAPEMIRGLNGPMMQSCPYNNAAGVGISQPDQSYTNSTQNLTSTMPSFTQATASTVSDNSRGRTTTTRSHVSSQINLTAPDAARAPRPVRHKIYHCTCTSKRCTEVFLRGNDWKRHEESHWPQQRYLCLRCVEKPGRLDDSQCSYCKSTILESWERHTLSCSDAQSDGKCFTREEHLRNHLRNGHRVSGSISKTEAERWFFRVESEWPRQCGFCNTIFTSWGQRAEHIRRHFRIDQCTIGMWREIPVLPLDDDDGLGFYQNKEDDSDDEVARREPRPSAASLSVRTSFTLSEQNNWQASEHGSHNSRGAVDHEKSHAEFLKLAFDKNQNYCIRPKPIPHPEEEVKRSLQKPASRVLLVRRSTQKSVQVSNDPLVKYRLPQIFQGSKGLGKYFCYIKDLFGFNAMQCGGASTPAPPGLEESLRRRMLESSDDNGLFPTRHHCFAIWIGCLASAIDFLHGHGIVHRGLTSINILAQGPMLHLYDFEAINKEDESLEAQNLYRASLIGRTGNIALLGCVFVELITVLEGIPLLDMLASCKESLEAPHHYLSSYRQWIKSLSYSTVPISYITMAKRMISHNVEDRPTIREIRAHFTGSMCFCQDSNLESRPGDKIPSDGNFLTKLFASSSPPTTFEPLLRHLPNGPTPLDLYLSGTKDSNYQRQIDVQALRRSSIRSDSTFNTSLSRTQTLTLRPASSVTSLSADSTQFKVGLRTRQTSNLATTQPITASDIEEAPQTLEETSHLLPCELSYTGFSTSAQEGQKSCPALQSPDIRRHLMHASSLPARIG